MDDDSLARLLLRIEAEENAKGWDRPGQLIAISPSRRLWRWRVDNVAQLDNPFLAWRPPWAPEAVAFMAEGWHLDVGNTADTKAFAARYSYGDVTRHPDRTEARTVNTLTTNGIWHFVLRERGEPVVHDTRTDESVRGDDDTIGVHIRSHHALRRLLEAWQEDEP